MTTDDCSSPPKPEVGGRLGDGRSEDRRPRGTCPICRSGGRPSRVQLGGFPLAYCPECVFWYAAEVPVEVENNNAALYEDLYETSSEYQSLLAIGLSDRLPKHLAFCEAYFLRRFPAGDGRTLLDVGCGAGRFLRIAASRGWKVQGVEIAPLAVELGRRQGLDIFLGDLTTFVRDFPQARFDAVVAFEVLEHVLEPVAFLETMGRLLGESGIVAFSVPNARDPFIFLDPRPETRPPVHVNFFTRRACRRAVKEAGLEPVAIRSNFLPIATLRQLLRSRFLRALARPVLAILALCRLIEGHQIVALAKRAGPSLPLPES